MKKHNIKFVRGDDETLSLSLFDEANDPLDLTGCKIDLHARDEDDNLVLVLSSDNPDEITVSQHQVIINIAHAKTNNAEWENANYDLQLIDSRNKRKTILAGKISLIQDITRV